MVFDIASVFSCDWNWKFSVAMLPLILLTLAPVTEAKNDFSVYRMNQYDIIKEPYGSRSGLVSFEGENLFRFVTNYRWVGIKLLRFFGDISTSRTNSIGTCGIDS